MPRSIKKRIKKEVVEVKVDEDRLEYIRYLGEDFMGAVGGGDSHSAGTHRKSKLD